MKFDLTSEERNETWRYLIEKLEAFYSNTEDYKAAFKPDRNIIKEAVVSNFDENKSIKETIDDVVNAMSKYTIHTPHPNHFGMFNPRANFPSILADVITAVFNPQLAAWGHAPYATEVENILIREISKKFGYDSSKIDGVFTTGGQEANLTGVLAALNNKFPNFRNEGVSSIKGIPFIYCSKASHHATIKAARVCGLGMRSIKYINVDAKQKMIPNELEYQIKKDLQEGHIPFLVVATMGTTGAGAIDPIEDIYKITEKFKIWLHADAAYGGAVTLTKEYKFLMKGIEKADSITFDIHKWLSVPMATSMFITKHTTILGKTFSVTSDYMPKEQAELDKLSSYTHSIQWSRRFNGLKLYMPLLVFGWQGYNEIINHHIKMGQLLKEKLLNSGWKLYNDTPLPIVCFGDERFIDNFNFSKYIYESFLETNNAWIAQYPIENKFTLRACITNYSTNESHLDQLIDSLNKKRKIWCSNPKNII